MRTIGNMKKTFFLLGIGFAYLSSTAAYADSMFIITNNTANSVYVAEATHGDSAGFNGKTYYWQEIKPSQQAQFQALDSSYSAAFYAESHDKDGTWKWYGEKNDSNPSQFAICVPQFNAVDVRPSLNDQDHPQIMPWNFDPAHKDTPNCYGMFAPQAKVLDAKTHAATWVLTEQNASDVPAGQQKPLSLLTLSGEIAKQITPFGKGSNPDVYSSIEDTLSKLHDGGVY